MRRVRYVGVGGNEVVRLESAPDAQPVGRQVLVRVQYAAVNPLDIIQRKGQYELPSGASADLPGVEVAGTVIAIGSQVLRWSVGDRVMGLVVEAGLADRVLADEAHLIPIPHSLSDLEAAALPEAVVTALDALDRARTTVCDVVGVRGVNGGVGLAAYQLAKAMGAAAVGIVRSSEVVQALEALGISVVLAADFIEYARQRGGADVIIDLIGGRYLAEDLRAMALCGRIVAVSLAAGNEATIPANLLLKYRIDLMGTTLRGRPVSEKAMVLADVEKRVLPLIANRQLVMPIEATYPANEVVAAFEHLDRPGKVGKVVLDFGGTPD
jgi:NADPH:quinone reductase